MINKVNISARDFGRIEAKVDSLIESFRAHAIDDTNWHVKIDDRIAKIERSGAFGAGRSSAFGTIAGAVAGAVAGFLGRHIG